MRRVCFFAGNIGRSGGTERVTTVVASALAELGFDVSILSLSHGENSHFPLHSAVRLHSLHMERHSANFSEIRIWSRLHTFLRQQAVERIVDVDTVHSWYSIPAARGTDAKVIAWEHFHLFVNVGDWPQRLRRLAGRRLAARWAAAVVTLTEKDRQQYLTHLPCRAPVAAIPNPVTIDHKERARLDAARVLSAGRLVSQKGFDMLIEAWAQISPRHPEWRLRIVGSGPEEALLKSRASHLNIVDRVEFAPNTVDMAAEFQSASIFACSSRFEGFGLVIVEAKSFGLPVVSFDCDCGPSDILRHEQDGLLVPKEDVPALAAALDRLMSNEKERKTFGQSAIEDTRFDLGRILPAWQRVLT
jgi:glycosyltransferase involved in cell wall biosynthesis